MDIDTLKRNSHVGLDTPHAILHVGLTTPHVNFNICIDPIYGLVFICVLFFDEKCLQGCRRVQIIPTCRGRPYVDPYIWLIVHLRHLF